VTPDLLRLYETVVQREAELLALERRRVGRLGMVPWWERWSRTGMPAIPAPNRLARLSHQWRDCGRTGGGGQLLESLAILDQTIAELSAPGAGVTRAARRGRRLVRRALSRMHRT